MEITILYDNEGFKKGLKSGYGFSALIRSNGKNILFDTGWDGGMLLSNMDAFGFSPRDIDVIVLSHWHWDHIGGLPTVLEITKNIDVFVPASFSQHLIREIEKTKKVHKVKEPVEIVKGVYSTGELEGRFNDIIIGEQALAIKTSKGLVVVVGCSHPGVDKILARARSISQVYGIIGGLHSFDNYGQLDGLGLIAPLHCTQHKNEIRNEFKDKVEFGGVGWSKIVE